MRVLVEFLRYTIISSYMGDVYQVSASPVILHLIIHTLHQPENLDAIKPSNELSQGIVLDYDFNWIICNFY